jgi:hypothetical protein
MTSSAFIEIADRVQNDYNAKQRLKKTFVHAVEVKFLLNAGLIDAHCRCLRHSQQPGGFPGGAGRY